MALTKEAKTAVRSEFAIHPGDTGSVEIQIAALSKVIQQLTAHCKVNAKDFATKHGLLKKVSQRKAFLKYLQRSKPESYAKVTTLLGLK